MIADFSDKIYDPTNSGVSESTLKFECTDRLRELSAHKGDYKGYKFANPVIRTVSEGAKSFSTTERLSTLCVPFSHKQGAKFVRIH